MSMFFGHSNLLQVECSGRYLPSNVDLTYLKLYRNHNTEVIAIAFPMKDMCKTFSQYTSCEIDAGDSRMSVVKYLMSHLNYNQSTTIWCNASIVNQNAHTHVYTWSISVEGKSKY